MSWTIEQEGNVFHISRDDQEARTFRVMPSGKQDAESKKLWFLNAEIIDLALDIFGGTEGDQLQRLETAWGAMREVKDPSPAKHPPGSKEDRAARAEAKTAQDMIDPDAIEEHRKEAWLEFYAAEDWEKYQAINSGSEEPPEDIWPEGLDARSYITKANLDDAFLGFEPSGEPDDDVMDEPETPKSEMHAMLEAATANADQMRRQRPADDAA